MLADTCNNITVDDNVLLMSNLRAGDMVWVKSEQFECECWGYVCSLGYTAPMEAYGKQCPEHIYVTVRLELDDEHPSMAEAIRDTGMDGDQVEIMDMIPLRDIEFIRYLDFSKEDRKPEAWKRPVTSSERAARHRRRGGGRVALLELDAALQQRYQSRV